MNHLDRQGSSVLSSFLALLGVREDESDDNEFVGTWTVKDSDGKPFEIVLAASGAAEADRDGEGMTGTWEMDGASAVINWGTGWTTKITRRGDTYVKTAYDATAAAPTNTSAAEKVG
jgi:hypothetical protein